MEIIEQKIFKSLDDVARLNFIDFSRLNGYWNDNPLEAMKVGNWLIHKAMYTLIKDDLHAYPIHPGFPKWEHVGGHVPIGRLFWNFFHARFDGTLLFHDSPDFSGSITFHEEGKEPSTIHFEGDIGQVSASTFTLDVLNQMHTGDLWISILDEKHQLVIEFLADLARLIPEHMEKRFELRGIDKKKKTNHPSMEQLTLFP